MKKSKWIQWLIGILGVVVSGCVVLLAIHLDRILPEPFLGIFKSKDADKETQVSAHPFPEWEEEENSDQTPEDLTPSDPMPPPEDLPPTVEIPPVTDPDTGEVGISFPCQVPGYDLTIVQLRPYSGMYVEDGTNATVENVAMLLVRNDGGYPVEYASIVVQYGDVDLTFEIKAMPADEQMVVQEKTGKSIPATKPTAAVATVVRRANMEMSRGVVEVVDNGNNTLTIRNLTDKMIPTVRVFYKYYMEKEDIFVGGIAFTVRVTRLDANSSVTIQPSHYSSETGRVVMVLTYDSEV